MRIIKIYVHAHIKYWECSISQASTSEETPKVDYDLNKCIKGLDENRGEKNL